MTAFLSSTILFTVYIILSTGWARDTDRSQIAQLPTIDAQWAPTRLPVRTRYPICKRRLQKTWGVAMIYKNERYSGELKRSDLGDDLLFVKLCH
jgi:hypothetical protein